MSIEPRYAKPPAPLGAGVFRDNSIYKHFTPNGVKSRFAELLRIAGEGRSVISKNY
jgi:hypothetical protein